MGWAEREGTLPPSATTSHRMRRVRVRRTAAERRVVRILRADGIRHTTRTDELPGRPDVLIEARIALFVDGCFWHGCPRCFRAPRSNRGWWLRKIDANRRRDRRKDRALRALSYRVLHVREHDSDERILRRIRSARTSDRRR